MRQSRPSSVEQLGVVPIFGQLPLGGLPFFYGLDWARDAFSGARGAGRKDRSGPGVMARRRVLCLVLRDADYGMVRYHMPQPTYVCIVCMVLVVLMVRIVLMVP